jgi:hypothetical protein
MEHRLPSKNLVKKFSSLSFIDHPADAAHGSIEAGLIGAGVFPGPEAATLPAHRPLSGIGGVHTAPQVRRTSP